MNEQKKKVGEIIDREGAIIDYIRTRKGQIIGIFVGIAHEGMICIGWAKTNLKAGDVFDKEYGLKLALDRAKNLESSPEIPEPNRWQMYDFQIRCMRYFQGVSVMSTRGPKVSVVDHVVEHFKDAVIERLFGQDLAPLFKAWQSVGMIVIE